MKKPKQKCELSFDYDGCEGVWVGASEILDLFLVHVYQDLIISILFYFKTDRLYS